MSTFLAIPRRLRSSILPPALLCIGVFLGVAASAPDAGAQSFGIAPQPFFDDEVVPSAFQQPGAVPRDIPLPAAGGMPGSRARGAAARTGTTARPASFTSADQAQNAAPTSLRSTSGSNPSASKITMFGDFPNVQVVTINMFATTYPFRYSGPTTGQGTTVGRVKIAENTSPIPQDRVYMSYSNFNDVPLNGLTTNVNRYTPGLEKTFFDGVASIDLRLPFAATFDNDVTANNGPTAGIADRSTVLGNMVMTLKTLLIERERFLMSGGLAFDLPTAPDTRLYSSPLVQPSQQVGRLEQVSWRYLPFLGTMWQPTNRIFVQGFTQFDIDSNGTAVYTTLAGVEREVGRLEKNNLLYADLAVGYWIIRNDDGRRFIVGLAPTFEMHYNKSLGTPTSLNQAQNQDVSATITKVDSLNLTFGTQLFLRTNTTISAAYILPTDPGPEGQFNGEFRLMLNQFFGDSTL